MMFAQLLIKFYHSMMIFSNNKILTKEYFIIFLCRLLLKEDVEKIMIFFKLLKFNSSINQLTNFKV